MKVFYRTLVILLLCLPVSAHAQQQQPVHPLQPYNAIGFYEITWGGLTVGGLVMAAQEDDSRYRMEAHVRSNGLAWAFTRHQSTTTVEGIKKRGRYIPQKFETEFSLRGKTRHIELGYAPDGKLTHHVVNPPDDPKKRPPASEAERAYAVDVLTPFFIHRTRAYAALQGGESPFTIRMYDGRRLTDLHYHVAGRQRVGWSRQMDVPVIRLNISRTALGGYRPKEMEDIRRNKDPVVSLLLSDDGTVIPLKLEVVTGMGGYYANLKQQCETLEQCLQRLK